MPSFCAVLHCGLKYSCSQGISFHKFPLDVPKVCERWIEFTGRGSEWVPSRWSSICSRHFELSAFREYLCRKRLKRNAVPTTEDNSISIETYHISSNLSPLVNSTNDDDSSETVNEKLLAHYPTPIETNCRLCGERNEPSSINMMSTFDDFEIDATLHKCLPTMNLQTDVDQSRSVCSDCISHLKQYSEFIDRVLSYQRDLMTNEQFNNRDEDTPALNAVINSISIKQEPINVKQEKIDNFHKRPVETASITPTLNIESKFAQEVDTEQSIDDEPPTQGCAEKPESGEREQTNNCEIMEIITLNNPVSFIDLDGDEAGKIELGKLKTENIVDIDQQVEAEHAYAKRASITPYHLKQEIVEINNEEENGTSTTEYNQFELTNTFICIHCSETFSSQESLDNHHKSKHLSKVKICLICDTSFDSIQKYLRHKIKAHLSMCTHCKRTFSSHIALTKHQKICSRELKDFYFSCKHCSENMQNLSQMKEHMKICDRTQISAEESRDGRLHHLNQASAINELKNYVCSFCYRDYDRFKAFMKHEEMHTQFGHTRDPKKILKSIESESTTAVKSEIRGILSCETCGKKFLSLSKLNEHRRSHSEKRTFSCSLCSKVFKVMSGLTQHIKSFHFKMKTFTCPVCCRANGVRHAVKRCRHSMLAQMDR